ncbi:SusC/RagA family TonB-linked outer membrane protein [Flavobacterium sp. 7A]|uniref:SusC/RagA family TonB-linked outer membrane protein n=1 Tax=Flavobacterium sp. 7A TaxID=2940571 RepID=UPI0022261E82|nr:TonB-dependent receptor [Flavobacterium sp. 7A]MCW2120502.1 TonB-linked SusC/RagA family outer membrane protein [Flavobacterium sp. 7A]
MKKQTLKKLMGFAIMLCSFSLFAQTIKVTGVVTEDGMPVPGLNVAIKGDAKGTTTDFDGKYVIGGVSSKAVLVFSYLGLKTQEVAVNGRTIVNVAMLADSQTLDEVVVVGYGTSSKRELTGSVASISSKDLTKSVASNPTTLLQGKMSGIQVESSGGQPGGSANVFIRGVNSLSNASPLYIVDGVIVQNMDYVNPSDILDISVLKDAATAAIYGARAANGVILIKTNHGRKNQEMEVRYNARIGFDTPSKYLDFLDGEQYTSYLNQRFANDGSAERVTYNGVSTDWQKQNLKSGLIQDHGLSLQGGSETASYFASVNYFKQDGILIGSGFKRLNARLNSEYNFRKLKITQTLGITEATIQENNWYGFDGTTAPTVALHNAINEGGYEAPSTAVQGPGGVNQFALATLEENSKKTRTLFGGLKFDYKITDNLSAGINFGLDYKNLNSFQFTPTYFMSTVDAVRNVNDKNDLTEYNKTTVNLLVEPTLSYDTKFGKNKIAAVAGYTYYKENQQSSGIYGQGTPSNSIKVVGALPSNSQLILLGENNTAGLISYFGRLNYNYDDRYLLSGTIRRDASSRFAADNQSGYFPSISGAWNISKESFWKSDVIDYFKLRTSYGILGSYPDTFYPTQAVYLANQSNTSFGGANATGLAQTTLADPNLSWETTKTFDIGVDLTFLNNKMNFTADYYSKNINDVLVAINVPSTAGVSLPVTRNAGSLVNKGFEFDMSYQKTDGDFHYKVGTNFSFNLVAKAGNIPAPILGPSIDEDLRVVNRTVAGQPIGSFYGYKVEDKVNPLTGDFVRVDVNKDGVIDEKDITNIGNPTPDFTYGLTFSGDYKNFDISLAFTGVQGNEIYNVGKYYNVLWQDGGKFTSVLNSWTPTNTDTNIPKASITDAAGNKEPSSFFVEDGSYLRLKNIEIGYNLPIKALGMDVFKSLRVSFNVQNAFVITKYSGYDPDVASTNGGRANLNAGVPGVRPSVNPLLGRGLDARTYPNARTFMLGLQATF